MSDLFTLTENDRNLLVGAFRQRVTEQVVRLSLFAQRVAVHAALFEEKSEHPRYHRSALLAAICRVEIEAAEGALATSQNEEKRGAAESRLHAAKRILGLLIMR